jgi:hypothetical protein
VNQFIYYENKGDDAIICCYVDTRGGSISVGSAKPVDKPDVTIFNNVDIAISIKISLQTTLRFLRGNSP